MPTLIKRDPFTRVELVREVHNPNPGETCAWCGQLRKNGKLFKYWWEGDRIIRQYSIKPKHAFCGIGCYQTFHY